MHTGRCEGTKRYQGGHLKTSVLWLKFVGKRTGMEKTRERNLKLEGLVSSVSYICGHVDSVPPTYPQLIPAFFFQQKSAT